MIDASALRFRLHFAVIVVAAFTFSQEKFSDAQTILNLEANLQLEGAPTNVKAPIANQSSTKTQSSTPFQPLPCPTDGLNAPAVPQTSKGQHSVSLSWKASKTTVDPAKNAVGYCVFRSETSNIPNPISACHDCQVVSENAVSGTGCIDDRVKDNTIYYYVVAYYVKPLSATGKAMLGPPSNMAKADTSKPQPGPPSTYLSCH